jgi:hypothetical protein
VFLVEPLQGMLLAQLSSAETVDFACELSVLVNESLPMGYEYKVKPLTEIKRSDELESLRQLVAPAVTLALGAPTLTPTETPETPKKKK